MNKPYKTGLLIGRFQPIHLVHKRMIEQSLLLCDKVIIMIGSAQESGTERNPFSYGLREYMLSVSFRKEVDNGTIQIRPLNDMTTEDDISPNWGKYVLDNCSERPDVMIYGNDDCRSGWFDKEDIKDISELIIARKDDVSATKVREYIYKGDFSSYIKVVDIKIRWLFSLLRIELLELEEKNEKKNI